MIAILQKERPAVDLYRRARKKRRSLIFSSNPIVIGCEVLEAPRSQFAKPLSHVRFDPLCIQWHGCVDGNEGDLDQEDRVVSVAFA
jgi:hypothetical protein